MTTPDPTPPPDPLPPPPELEPADIAIEAVAPDSPSRRRRWLPLASLGLALLVAAQAVHWSSPPRSALRAPVPVPGATPSAAQGRLPALALGSTASGRGSLGGMSVEVGPPQVARPDDPASGRWDCRVPGVEALLQEIGLSPLGLATFEGESWAFEWKCDGVWTATSPGVYSASALCDVRRKREFESELLTERVDLTLGEGGVLRAADRKVRRWECARLTSPEAPQ